MSIFVAISFVFLSAILTRALCSLAQNTRLMDKPNARSLHTRPVVRGGGLVFIGLPLLALPFLCYFSRTPIRNFSTLIISTLLLASVCFLDDLYQLSARLRFFVQSLVSLLIVLFLRPDILDFGWFVFTSPVISIPFLFFAVIWAINHFNFMDGIDGFCALQAMFLFSAYGIFFGFYNAVIYQNLCFIFTFSLTGFLLFNFPPAKLFMGDVGSATLGLIIFCLALIAQQKYHLPILYWFMLNGLFLFDSIITLLRRIKNKENISSAHKKHAYQRLKQSGVKTSVILLGQLVINIIFLGLVLLVYMDQLKLTVALLFQLCVTVLIYYFIERKDISFRVATARE